jgi:uncharacterized protein (DUF169 family)
MKVNSKQLDYSIFDKFNFERKPVGVKYSLEKPEGIKQLDKRLGICEMFKEAQTSQPFYATEENVQCGEHVVGLVEFPPVMYSGQLGKMFAMFRTPGANRRIYDYVPILPKDSVKYIIHSSLDQMSFDPDILIITANTTQAEIILRASSYTDGKMWNFKGTTCLACAWIYAHPYLNGELNCTVSGLGYSMKAREVLPEGLIIITVPFDLLPGLIKDLEDIEWEPYWFKLGRDGFVNEVKKRSEGLAQELGQPEFDYRT